MKVEEVKKNPTRILYEFGFLFAFVIQYIFKLFFFLIRPIGYSATRSADANTRIEVIDAWIVFSVQRKNTNGKWNTFYALNMSLWQDEIYLDEVFCLRRFSEFLVRFRK